MIDTTTLKTNAPDMLALVSPLTPLRKVGATMGGEWSGPCPFCGGDDRFSVQPYHQPEARWLCRSCTDGKWQDIIEFVQRRDGSKFTEAVNVLFGDNVRIAMDPRELEALKSKQQAAIRAQEQAELERHQQRRQSLHDSKIWLEYYNNLDKFGRRDLWYERGLSDYFIDVYKVGYCPAFQFGKEQHPTLTIPSWHNGIVTGLSHRALADNPSGGKYRPERAGLGKPLFYADPNQSGIAGKVLLLEGEIKTMVTFAHIYATMPEQPHPLYTYNLIGIAGTGFKNAWLPEFEKATEVIICLDPDATETADKIAGLLGAHRCRVVELPGKIDDLINMGVLYKENLYKYIRDARKSVI